MPDLHFCLVTGPAGARWTCQCGEPFDTRETQLAHAAYALRTLVTKYQQAEQAANDLDALLDLLVSVAAIEEGHTEPQGPDEDMPYLYCFECEDGPWPCDIRKLYDLVWTLRPPTPLTVKAATGD